MRSVLILCGPTASGKSKLAVDLAITFDAEIVGADSRQIYRGMPIGTAAPIASDLSRVPHHLIGFLDPLERYSAARFCADAMRAIEDIHGRGKRAIVAGGTGFYIRALTGAVSLAPQYDEAVRTRLAREANVHDAAFLHEWLTLRDPARAARIDRRDAYRVLRALEVALAPGAVRSDAPHPSLPAAGIAALKVALQVAGDELDRRIERRAREMLDAGLVDEAQRVGPLAVAASAVGYPQALAFSRGWCTREELCSLLARATRRYAKRQATWFRSEPGTYWAVPSAVESIAREKLGWV